MFPNSPQKFQVCLAFPLLFSLLLLSSTYNYIKVTAVLFTSLVEKWIILMHSLILSRLKPTL